MKRRTPRPRHAVLTFMATLYASAGLVNCAAGCMVELFAICVFGDREGGEGCA